MALRPATKHSQRVANKLITRATSEPVTLAEVKTHMRVTDDDSDKFIIPLITQAREILESLSGICFLNQTWSMTMDDWGPRIDEPWWEGTRQGYIGDLSGSITSVEIVKYPLNSVTSVTVYDGAGNATVADLSVVFDIDTESKRGRISLKQGQTWPVALRRTNAITIVYVAGYGASPDDVPQPLKLAINSLVAFLFSHRGNCGMHDAYNQSGAADILRLYRDQGL